MSLPYRYGLRGITDHTAARDPMDNMDMVDTVDDDTTSKHVRRKQEGPPGFRRP